jgi:putative resolvase
VKLREWAEREGVHYQTAWRWWRDGKLPVPARQTETGTILVDVPVPGCAAGAVL